jgi:L-arabinonolactonase
VIERPAAECAVDCRNILGESCAHDPRDGSVYWTDIEGHRIWRLPPSSGQAESFAMPDRVAFIRPRARDGFVIGFADRIAVADSRLMAFETVCPVEPDLPQTRVNDAAVDPAGGIVFGTFDERERRPVAALYRLAPDGALSQLLDSVTIANGIAFSPDGALMYFADTPAGTVRRFAVGQGSASFDERAPLCDADVAPGRPDGAIVDAEGCYWSARVWGSCVARISPDGRLLETIPLAAAGPTCVAFAGPELRDLFITTLRTRQTNEELAATPLAGGLFRATVPVGGSPTRLAAL